MILRPSRKSKQDISILSIDNLHIPCTHIIRISVRTLRANKQKIRRTITVNITNFSYTANLVVSVSLEAIKNAAIDAGKNKYAARQISTSIVSRCAYGEICVTITIHITDG